MTSGSTTVYSGRTTNWPVVGLLIAGGLGLALFGRPWAGPWPGMIGPLLFVLGLLAVAVLTTTSLRVTTGPRGVQVWCGPLGWPRFDYARERIVTAQIVPVSIWRTWNWGLNWTPRSGWAFVLRSGPALRLTLTNGRKITVGAADPAAALAALGLSSAG